MSRITNREGEVILNDDKPDCFLYYDEEKECSECEFGTDCKTLNFFREIYERLHNKLKSHHNPRKHHF